MWQPERRHAQYIQALLTIKLTAPQNMTSTTYLLRPLADFVSAVLGLVITVCIIYFMAWSVDY